MACDVVPQTRRRDWLAGPPGARAQRHVNWRNWRNWRHWRHWRHWRVTRRPGEQDSDGQEPGSTTRTEYSSMAD